MKLLIIVLFLAILWCGFTVPWFIREYARRSSDKIIQGQRPATEKRINRCASILIWSADWITDRKAPDDLRIKRLHMMLDEMQKPHG